jgi:hypothetical protein
MHKLTDLTPEEFRCKPLGPTCPAVLRRGDKYVIIGTCVALRQIFVDEYPELPGRVGPGEAAVEISAELLEAAIAKEAAGR